MPSKEVELFMALQSHSVLSVEQESSLIKQLEDHDLTKNEKMHIINLLPDDMLSLELVTHFTRYSTTPAGLRSMKKTSYSTKLLAVAHHNLLHIPAI